MGHSICNAYVIGDHNHVIERQLSNFCLQDKTAAARGKRDNDDLQCIRCL